MNRKAVLKNPTFLDTIYRRYIVWIDIYSRSFESIPNFRNDKLLFLQIVIDGYRLLIKFNPLILQILECTYFYRSVRDARKICFKSKNHRALYTYTCVIHVFVKAIRLLKYLDGSRRTNWFVNWLLNLVYLVILFTTFLLRFIETVVASPSIRWTDVWFRFRVLFTTTCLEAPRVMKKLRPSTKLDCAAGLIFWMYLFLDPFTGRTLRIVRIVWSRKSAESCSHAGRETGRAIRRDDGTKTDEGGKKDTTERE